MAVSGRRSKSTRTMSEIRLARERRHRRRASKFECLHEFEVFGEEDSKSTGNVRKCISRLETLLEEAEEEKEEEKEEVEKAEEDEKNEEEDEEDEEDEEEEEEGPMYEQEEEEKEKEEKDANDEDTSPEINSSTHILRAKDVDDGGESRQGASNLMSGLCRKHCMVIPRY